MYALTPFRWQSRATCLIYDAPKFFAPARILKPLTPKYTASAPAFSAALRQTKSPAGAIISGIVRRVGMA